MTILLSYSFDAWQISIFAVKNLWLHEQDPTISFNFSTENFENQINFNYVNGYFWWSDVHIT